MLVVEYYMKGDNQRHARYFASRVAARNFYQLMVNDPNCAEVRTLD